MSKTRWCPFSIACVTIITGASRAATIDVPGDAPSIMAAIAAPTTVDGDVVLVAPGTWHETVDLLGKAITLRSTGGPRQTTIDATGLAGSVIRCDNDEGYDTIIEGFTIRGGIGETSIFGVPAGAGLLTFNTSPTVRNCIFTDNGLPGGQTIFGGGIFVFGDARISDCTFFDNRSHNGAGINVLGGDPEIIDCRFVQNTAASGGGGIFIHSGTPHFTRLVFDRNVAHKGGALATAVLDLQVTDSRFAGNRALSEGGAVSSDGAARLTLASCTIVGNRADVGGAIANRETELVIVNCTITENVASGPRSRGGGVYSVASTTTIANSILWNNEAAHGRELYTEFPVFTIARFSDLCGYDRPGTGWPSDVTDGGGNIDIDPRFVRAPDDGGDGWGDDPATIDIDESANDDFGDLRLSTAPPSACIDAGHNSAVPADIFDDDDDGDVEQRLPLDLDLAPRFADSPSVVRATGCGAPAIVDIGAYEHAGPAASAPYPGDLDDDGVVDARDLFALLRAWGTCDRTCCPADLDLSATVGFADLLRLLAGWS